jgi:TonB family protein
MTNYLIELSAIHAILMLGYWIFLRNERQYATLRFYLIAVFMVSLLVPALRLPKLFGSDTPMRVVSNEVVVVSSSTSTVVNESSFWTYELLLWVPLIVSLFFLLRFLNSLRYLILLRHKYSPEKSGKFYIYRIRDIQGSFSFFNWIFIGEQVEKDQLTNDVTLAHEQAHTRLGHSYDTILRELFKIGFWWLPTTWYQAAEIRKIHEYQADLLVLKSYSTDEYSSVLISSTLKMNGIGLASSFHDGLISKRLTAMRNKTRKVSPWKLGVLATLCTLLVIAFACTEDRKSDVSADAPSDTPKENGIFTIVEKMPEFDGGPKAFYGYVMNEVKYPSEARQKKVEGRVNVEFVVDKDGSISDAKAVNGPGAGCEAEAVRALKHAPSFSPASQQGKPVRVKMMLPVVFKLNDKESSDPKGVIVIEDIQPINQKFKVDASYSDGQWTGTVYDEEGEKLPGAAILVEGTTAGTNTDSNGAFRIKADEAQNLVVSFVGYEFVKLEGKK